MPCAQWMRAAVGGFIERSSGIKLSMRGVVVRLGRWGCTLQMPTKKACEQSPAASKKWLGHGSWINSTETRSCGMRWKIFGGALAAAN
ncbi:helix-turn-helix domain-containing protein [Rubrivivax gelatinosus]|uniref:Winged helix-turn helix domain-containing protein n=1 Tax=Rubrivivax gelatinosus TaxID=28068 RepID=A0ABS1DXC9_RUBGE|nr:winged helix-turn-helix domain-containing protein [Rubrivivax gelatinosus]MBK1713776.1 hypothetical protein [Rubrivivax gelatinosus]